MIAYLKENIYSYFKHGKKDYHLYGKAGDQVKVISARGNVMIVESAAGTRYPAETEKLNIVEISETTMQIDPLKYFSEKSTEDLFRFRENYEQIIEKNSPGSEEDTQKLTHMIEAWQRALKIINELISNRQSKDKQANNNRTEIMTTQEILQKCTAFGYAIKLPDIDLDNQSEYLPLKKILENAGGRWSIKIPGFVFDRSASGILAELTGAGPATLSDEPHQAMLPEKPETIVNNSIINPTEMDFFKQISELMGQTEVSLVLKAKGDKLTVMVAHNVKNEQISKIPPIIVTGTPDELDEGFFTEISPAVSKITGLTSNVSEVEKSLEGASSADDSGKKEKKSRKSAKAAATAPDQLDLEEEAAAAGYGDAPEEEPVKVKTEEELEQERLAEEEATKKAEEEQKERDRLQRYDEIMAQVKEFEDKKLYREAALSLKSAKEFSLDPDFLNDQIKGYLVKAAEAEMEDI